MKTILLPTDFSENSWKAVEYALELYENETCKFYILHALEPQASAPSAGITSKKASQMIHESRMKATEEDFNKFLNRVTAFSNNPKHSFETVLVHGSLVAAVEGYVEENDIELVVIGNKGASALQKVTFGSNAAQLILKLSCPLIAIPESAKVSISEIYLHLFSHLIKNHEIIHFGTVLVRDKRRSNSRTCCYPQQNYSV